VFIFYDFVVVKNKNTKFKIENNIVFIRNKPCYLPILMLNSKKAPRVCKICEKKNTQLSQNSRNLRTDVQHHLETMSSNQTQIIDDTQPKFVLVDFNCLLDLFELVHLTCKQFNSAIPILTKVPIIGSAIQLELICINGHKTLHLKH
jgi:hypothetical protein